LSGIKKLAGQTIWYGVSSIFGRLLNYLLTPVLTAIFLEREYGKISILFTIAALLNIIYTYGMETSYFRFASSNPESKVYNTASTSIWFTTALFTILLLLLTPSIAAFYELSDNPEYITWIVLIVGLDTLAVMPFAKLRFEGRPRKYALIRILNILINVGLVLFIYLVCKPAHETAPGSFPGKLYNPEIGLGYVILANLAASGITLLLLSKELFQFRLRINPAFWKEMMSYSWPLIIVGFGGIINETIDRLMLLKLLPGTSEENFGVSGIYSANYKLAILIVLFIQAFRLGAEPFFFKQSTGENAPRTYARVMKFFVIACCFCFLGVTMFLDIWKHFMSVNTHPNYALGLKVVPVLMLAKIFLGIYYNLSIWYKLKNKNLTGAMITIGGALITIAFNWIFIPVWGYMACAIATLLCYGFMMVASYLLGQKHYPVPYAWKKLMAYIVISVLLFLVHYVVRSYSQSVWLTHGTGLVLLAAFAIFVLQVEKKEFSKLPFIGRFLYPRGA
jgi:O-antigen/teichoic acid export membrane protein